MDLSRGRTLYHAVGLGHYAHAGVHGRLFFHTCSNHRRLCHKKRHGLTLHVGTHQGTVGVVIFQEGDEGRCHGEYHLRGNVHVIEHAALILLSLFPVTTGYVLTDEMTFLVQRLVGLSHVVIVFLIRRHIYNFIGNHRILRVRVIDLAVRSLHESVLVDPGVAGQGVDQSDVGTFRGLNGTHSSVVGIVYVTHLESGPVSGKTSRSKG